MLKMQKSRFAVFCLICVLLAIKAGICSQKKACLQKLQDTAHYIIKPHVDKLSMNCHHLTENEVQFSNRTNCIVKWMDINYTDSEESEGITKLKNISVLLKRSMFTLQHTDKCFTVKRNQSTTCNRNECLSKFLKCWCGFIETMI